LFDTAVEVIKYGFSFFRRGEKEEHPTIVDACPRGCVGIRKDAGAVARAGQHLMGLRTREASMLDAIKNTLRRRS
jgi:hypothetical protein